MSENEGGDPGSGDLNVFEESPYFPDLKTGSRIPHYYGDYVRQIFLMCGAIMLVLSPFMASSSPGILPFEIGGAIIIAILGALTNPVKQISLLANAIAAGVGVVVYELLALNAFYAGSMMIFLAREVLVVAFLIALYYSLKTLRNMMLNVVGKRRAAENLIEKQNENN